MSLKFSFIATLCLLIFLSCKKENSQSNNVHFGNNKGHILFYMSDSIPGSYIEFNNYRINLSQSWPVGFKGDCSDTITNKGFTLEEGFYNFKGGASNGDKFDITLFIKAGECRIFQLDY